MLTMGFVGLALGTAFFALSLELDWVAAAFLPIVLVLSLLAAIGVGLRVRVVPDPLSPLALLALPIFVIVLLWWRLFVFLPWLPFGVAFAAVGAAVGHMRFRKRYGSKPPTLRELILRESPKAFDK